MQGRDGGAVYTVSIIERRFDMAGLKENTPEDVRQAMEYLIRTVSNHKGAVVVGYVFGADPVFISQFSNVKPETFEGTVEEMLKFTKMKQAQGLVIHNRVERPA